jgi:hypothetical protein
LRCHVDHLSSSHHHLVYKTLSNIAMPPKSQFKATTKAAANSRKRQASNADQQPVKRSRRGTKTKNDDNDDINPEDAAAADFEDQATKARGKGGKKAAKGRGKKGPAAARYVVHTIDGNRAIDRVLFPPHLKPTDIPPQENHAGSQSRGCCPHISPQVQANGVSTPTLIFSFPFSFFFRFLCFVFTY